jgi:hypothetical protein
MTFRIAALASPPFTSAFSPALTNAFGLWANASATLGGLVLDGVSNGDGVALVMRGLHGSASPTTQAIVLRAYKSDGGAGFATLAATETLFEVQNNTTARFAVKGTGNVGINTTSFGTSAGAVLALGTGTAPSTSPADVVQLWEADRGGTAGKGSLHIRSEDGTSHVLGDRVGIGTVTPGALLDVGTAGTTLGVVRLAGSTSGNVTVQPAAIAGTWTLTLPTTAGNAGEVLQTDGSGVTTWVPPATVVGSGLPWTEVTGTTQTMSANNGYVANNAALVTLTLPTTIAAGDVLEVLGKGAGGWRVAQNASQQIQNGVTGTGTTVGTGGYIDSTTQYATIRLRCVTANLLFVID